MLEIAVLMESEAKLVLGGLMTERMRSIMDGVFAVSSVARFGVSEVDTDDCIFQFSAPIDDRNEQEYIKEKETPTPRGKSIVALGLFCLLRREQNSSKSQGIPNQRFLPNAVLQNF
jgi:hypothetical protein